jgi:hypothetical protein
MTSIASSLSFTRRMICVEVDPWCHHIIGVFFDVGNSIKLTEPSG